jgi:hypothetical protein
MTQLSLPGFTEPLPIRDMTAGEVARIVSRLAWWIDNAPVVYGAARTAVSHVRWDDDNQRIVLS